MKRVLIYLGCVSNQDITLWNVISSFNINDMIFFLIHFLMFSYCFVPNLRKLISLDGFNMVIKFH
jgi:hypothetical protein